MDGSALSTAIQYSLFTLLVWLAPLAITIWLLRTLTAMAAAQREIAERLASIDEHFRGGR